MNHDDTERRFAQLELRIAQVDAQLAVTRRAVARLEAMRPAPVITDSGRDCTEANPGSGAWCHKSGPHKTHRDTDGETWETGL